MFFDKRFDEMSDDELKRAAVQLEASGHADLAAKAEAERERRMRDDNPYEAEGEAA